MEAVARTGRILGITKYEVVDEIGHGGMATVYRARDPRLGREVALKVIHPHLRDSVEVKHRFYVEAQAVAKLRHPNIVEVFDVSAEDEREQYLVVELLRGFTMRKLLRDSGPIPPEVAASLGVEMLGALGHAHASGVVHRDVKPENVMIEPGAAAGPLVKLTDFGIAKLLDAQGVTSTGQVLGSPAHMAPEQIEGGDVDARADIFALGVLLYEAMVGHLPFEGANPAQVLRRVLDGVYPPAERERPTVGKRWSLLLDRALAQKPEDRFPNAAAMRDAIVAELSWMGAEPGAELVSYFADPAAYVVGHRGRIIRTLCSRAAEARKTGDVIAAAAYSNRALAYAPDDAALLKLVASIHRAEQRGRLLRRGGGAVAFAAGVGLLAFGVSRAVRAVAVGGNVLRAPAVVPSVVTSAPAPNVAIPDAAVPLSSAEAGVSGGRAQVGSPSPPPRPALRELTIASTWPAFGVFMAVDGEERARDIVSPFTFSVDGRPHVLHFTCAQDLCEPLDRPVAAGDDGETVSITLRIRPAMLLVEGDLTLTYQVVEEPAILVRAGVPAPVPMRSRDRRVTVIELPSNETREVQLVAAREARVRFEPRR